MSALGCDKFLHIPAERSLLGCARVPTVSSISKWRRDIASIAWLECVIRGVIWVVMSSSDLWPDRYPVFASLLLQCFAYDLTYRSTTFTILLLGRRTRKITNCPDPVLIGRSNRRRSLWGLHPQNRSRLNSVLRAHVKKAGSLLYHGPLIINRRIQRWI